jgi:tetratricopeptide (TPR) repeat protein
MFFPRLRRQAKWMFIVLIVVFGAGFVFLGVGSGGLDLGTLVQNLNVGGSSKPSVDKALDEVQKNPSTPAPYRKLAKALEAHGRTAEAITALQRVTALAPKDTAALQELAGLQRNQISTFGQEALAAQATYQDSLSSQSLGPPGSTPLGQALAQDPISSVVSSNASKGYSDALAKYQGAIGGVVDTYKKLSAAAPRDASRAYELAQVADQYRDYKTAIAAYRKFLVLAPDSTDAPSVRARVKQLQRVVKASASGG